MAIGAPPPPRPNGLVYAATLLAAKDDGARQAAARAKYWGAVIARLDYLDARAAAFKLDQPCDAYLCDEVRTGITRRIDRLHELARSVRAWLGGPSPTRWVKAQGAYEEMEKVAVNTYFWIRTGRAEAAALARRAQYQRAGTEANRRRASKAARKYIRLAKQLRRDHPTWKVGSIIAHIRRTTESPLSASQIRRHLEGPHGLK